MKNMRKVIAGILAGSIAGSLLMAASALAGIGSNLSSAWGKVHEKLSAGDDSDGEQSLVPEGSVFYDAADGGASRLSGEEEPGALEDKASATETYYPAGPEAECPVAGKALYIDGNANHEVRLPGGTAVLHGGRVTYEGESAFFDAGDGGFDWLISYGDGVTEKHSVKEIYPEVYLLDSSHLLTVEPIGDFIAEAVLENWSSGKLTMSGNTSELEDEIGWDERFLGTWYVDFDAIDLETRSSPGVITFNRDGSCIWKYTRNGAEVTEQGEWHTEGDFRLTYAFETWNEDLSPYVFVESGYCLGASHIYTTKDTGFDYNVAADLRKRIKNSDRNLLDINLADAWKAVDPSGDGKDYLYLGENGRGSWLKDGDPYDGFLWLADAEEGILALFNGEGIRSDIYPFVYHEIYDLLTIAGTVYERENGRVYCHNADNIPAVSASSTLKGYTADSLLDDDPLTAWFEGAEGLGEGEYLSFRFVRPDLIYGIEVFPGYTKSKAVYAENGVPTKLSVESGGMEVLADIGSYRPMFHALQPIRVYFDTPLQVTDHSVKVTIEEARKGTSSEHTGISGLRFLDEPEEEKEAASSVSAADQEAFIQYIRDNYYYTQANLGRYQTDGGILIQYLTYGFPEDYSAENSANWSAGGDPNGIISYNYNNTVVKLAENHRNDPRSRFITVEAFFVNTKRYPASDFNPITDLLFLFAVGKDGKEYRYYFMDRRVIRYVDPDHDTYDYPGGIDPYVYGWDYDPDDIFEEMTAIVPLFLSEGYFLVKDGLMDRPDLK